MKFNFESWQEFLDWNVKRENHIKELEQHNYELEMENMKLRHEEDHELYGMVNRFVEDIRYTQKSISNNIGDSKQEDYEELAFDLVRRMEDMQKKNATAENSDE